MTMPAPDAVTDVTQIDLDAPEAYRSGSPHGSWAALRRSSPVWWQRTAAGVEFWSLTRYADIVAVLKDTTRFTSSSGTLLAVIDGDPAGGHTILLTDPPEHTYLKSPIAKLMTRHNAPAHVERIATTVRALARQFLDGEPHDFAELMSVLPMAAAGTALGVPEEHWADVARWTMTGLAPEDPAFATGTPAETVRTAHNQLLGLLNEIIEERRLRPGDDLITALCSLDFAGRLLTTDEVLLNCYTLAMGTNSTTPHVASHLMLALIERPEAWRMLREDRGLVPLAVEEAVRWASPTNHLMRRATVDVRIHGRTIPAGAPVCLWLASANRDDAVFDRPYDFIPTRKPNPHIGFGAGTHYCIGARAARMVISTLLDELLDKFDRFTLAGEPRHLYSNFVNGMSSLPLVGQPRVQLSDATIRGRA
jgi:cytochrome P450